MAVARLDYEDAVVALERISPEDRGWVLSLPPPEAARVIEALVVFPDSVFAADGSVALDLFEGEPE